MPWRPAVLKGTRVLARCDAAGAFVDEGGRVEIRYRPNDGRAYRAAARNLEPVAGSAVLPDDHCVAGAPVNGDGANAQPGAKAHTSGSGARSTSASRAVKPSSRTALSAVARGPDAATFVAYTDGACSGNPGPCGLGVVLMHGESRRELSEYLGTGTNNIAELTAILRALEALDVHDEPVLVHTDSQYAIGVLQKGWRPKANQELIARTKERMKSFSALRLVYVPGHAGVPLNERADVLARQAVSARKSAGWHEIKAAAGERPEV